MNERIENTEIEYYKCFAKDEEDELRIRFRDNLLPDMYDHNFTLIKKDLGSHDLNNLISEEMDLRKAEHRDFVHLMLLGNITGAKEESVIEKPEISRYGYYAYEAGNPDFMKGVPGCEIVKVSTPEMIDDLFYCDLKLDGGRLSEDFCRRRAYRRGQVYLLGEGVFSYICYHQKEPVGKCDLFIFGRTAKIEDFEVLPDHQRKGYGTTILRFLINEALSRGCDLIYLVTDEEDTVKDMYQKLGFRKLGERTELFYLISE
jgi:spore maturation protein CgeE